MHDLKALETKLAAARTRLILEKPFLGALVMHLPLKASDAQWCKTTATDAKNKFISSVSTRTNSRARVLRNRSLRKPRFTAYFGVNPCRYSANTPRAPLAGVDAARLSA